MWMKSTSSEVWTDFNLEWFLLYDCSAPSYLLLWTSPCSSSYMRVNNDCHQSMKVKERGLKYKMTVMVAVATRGRHCPVVSPCLAARQPALGAFSCFSIWRCSVRFFPRFHTWPRDVGPGVIQGLKQHMLRLLCRTLSGRVVVCLSQECVFFQLADMEGLSSMNQPQVEQVIVSRSPLVAISSTLWQ